MDNLIKGTEVSETLDSLLAKKDYNTVVSAVEAGILTKIYKTQPF